MANIIIPDGGTIGSTSDTDALTITNTGVVKASQSIATGTIKDATGVNNSISIATNGEATFAENIVIGTAGKGIDFSQSQTPASGMTAEILDSYEEGTFSGTVSGSVYDGTYTKIGRICHVSFSTNNSSSTGTSIVILPFSAKSGFQGFNGAQPTVNTSSSSNNVFVGVYNGGTTAYLYSSSGGTLSVTSGVIYANFVYETD